jgi:signal transduction histidine kinase/CheY-like chemotaxis protein
VADLLRAPSGPFSDPAEWERLLEGARASDGLQGVDVRWQRRDGAPITVRLSGRAVRGEGGVLEGLELLAEDVTERRSLELQVQRAQKMEAVGRLAGGIAHDFNNLLVAILGYGDMLAASIPESDPLRRCVEQIQRAGDRAVSLTRQLLAFSRRQVIDCRVLSPNEVVAGMEPMLRRLIGENLVLETRLDPSLARTRADRGQLEQVVMNLVVNARDAMPRGGTITIATRGAEVERGAVDATGAPFHSGRYVVLAVTDTGTGMSAEVQSRLFEPFFTTKEEGKGTGLGLSTVYAIVRNVGGSVSVTSRLGVGSTLEVWLPATDEAPEVVVPAAPSAPAAPSGETILLVEDESAVRDLSRTLLTQAGYRVFAAADATEALALLAGSAKGARLLVTDLVLPDLSGIELAQQVLQLAPDTRVLLTSGYTAHSIDVATLEGLRASFLQKPFRIEAFLASVRKALSGAASGTKA